ncbi:MAG: cytochrome C oxidase subunit IV family protein [Gammaproteobacteria bacterium]|nr:cytochrome C oxidase subunit IV family protein [Gammaproteobacteria bacterium]
MTRDLRGRIHDANDVAWLVLMAATALAWWCGRAAQGRGDAVRIAMAGVVLTATFKVGVVGYQFMELKTAPRWLQLAFAAWLLGISAALVVIICG